MKPIHPSSYALAEIREVNQKAAKTPQKFVAECEGFYNAQLSKVVKRLSDERERYKFVLLSGPSGSGKTTTAHKLKERLGEVGVRAQVVSLDNFFVGIENYPLLQDGTPDMESIETLDLELLNQSCEVLFADGKANFPLFDFSKQQRSHETEELVLERNGVIIMEGIHALNKKVLSAISDENIFRIYVSVRTMFTDKGREVLRPSDIRLLRRMVRDHLFRNYSPMQTLEYWHNVRSSEVTCINPFRDEVDIKMDNTLDYEVCVWHQLLQDLLEEHSDKVKNHPKLQHIFESLQLFESLDVSLIPADSLLREFIGAGV